MFSLNHQKENVGREKWESNRILALFVVNRVKLKKHRIRLKNYRIYRIQKNENNRNPLG